MTPRELILSTSNGFRAAGIPDPDYDAAMLLAHLTGKVPLELRLDTESQLDPDLVTKYRRLAGSRLERVPLQYLLGGTSFCGRVFAVDRRVLIPRPETEYLCEWALEVLEGIPSPRVLDLCCGSGAIGLTVKAEHPDASVTLSDISPEALEVAACNAARLSLDVVIRRCDLLDGFSPSSFDLIVTNPPYIPTGECSRLQPEVLMEPRLALDGGRDGCDFYRRIIIASGAVLSPGGYLLMEMGIHESGLISGFLSVHGFTGITIRKDIAGIDRMILASRA